MHNAASVVHDYPYLMNSTATGYIVSGTDILCKLSEFLAGPGVCFGPHVFAKKVCLKFPSAYYMDSVARISYLSIII